MVYLYILPQINEYVKFFTHHILPKHNLTIKSEESTDTKILISDTLKIQQIRELIHYINLRPASDKKIAIVGPFENATIEAQNAFLKILEDRPDYAYIFLFSHNIHKVLNTIKSRCQIIDITRQTNFKSKYLLEPTSINSQIISLDSTLARFSKSSTNTNVISRNELIQLIGLVRKQAIQQFSTPQQKLKILQDIKILEHAMSLNTGNLSIYKQLLLLIDKYNIRLKNNLHV